MFKKYLRTSVFHLTILMIFASCQRKKVSLPVEQKKENPALKYAQGFKVERNSNFTVITVLSAWPGADEEFSYALIPRDKLPVITLPKGAYDAIVATPVNKLVATSTTHIPALEALDELDALVGFPNTDFISSPKARERIDQDKVAELGINEDINTEIALDIQPEVVIGFGINGTNKAYETLKLSGIPIVYNGDWTEQTPLGKAEWIKFFAPFFQKEAIADSIFNTIETSYNHAKLLAKKSKDRPSVLTGGLFKDVWYVSGGNSWMSEFLNDANVNYLWSDTEETGSIGLSLEEILVKGKEAEFWLNPSSHASYDQLIEANIHYQQFDAFRDKRIYSNAIEKGKTGGILFYELAPQRPDLVLKDLISIFHPGVLENYQPHFFRPLQ